MKISIKEIRSLLVGRIVNIRHEGKSFQKVNRTGTCIAVQKSDSGADIELEDGSCWGLHAHTLTNKSVEGNSVRGPRKIELASSEQILREQFWMSPDPIGAIYGPWNSKAEMSAELKILGFARIMPYYPEIWQSSDGQIELKLIRFYILPPYKLESLLS